MLLRLSAYIEEHIDENPTLVDIARQIGYSPWYCSAMFHRATGMTLRGYIAARRLSLAALRLRDSREPVAQIALACGFSSQSALTRAFQKAFGISPYRYRRRPVPIPLQIRLNPTIPSDEKGGNMMNDGMKVDVRTEYIPAHRYLGAYGRTETRNGPIWPGHDCELLCGLIESMTHTDRIVTAFTAGWDNTRGERRYFFGSGIDVEADDVTVPEGLELRSFPGSYYLVFACPPFRYPEENAAMMSLVEQAAWGFDPAPLGLEWNEEVCQCYQRHSPEVLGYQVLRPVRKIR